MRSNPSFFDVPAADNTERLTRPVGSVWRRFAAYAMDSALLGAAGAGIGSVFFDKLSQIGVWGRLVGFVVALVYFSLFDSRMGNGQSLGKRLLRLRIIDTEGNAIPFVRSLLRSAIFLVPSFLFEMRLPETRTPWIVSALIFVIVSWVGCSTLYLITFNHQTRQGLHDLATRSCVANRDDAGPVKAEPVHVAQWMLLGTLLLVITAAAAILNAKLNKMPPLPEMRQDSALIEQTQGVQRARLRDTLLHSPARGGANKTLLVSVTLRSKSLDQEAFAEQVARIVLQNDQNAQNYDRLGIRLFFGYDIGIAQHWNHEEYLHTPAEWRRLFGTPPLSNPKP